MQPKMKGADAHRTQPEGGPTGGSNSGSTNTSGGAESTGASGDAPSPDTGADTLDDVGGGGSLLEISPGTKRRLLIGGGVALGAVALYFLLKQQGGDRGSGRSVGADDGGDGGDGGVKGYPNINRTPEDPLAADEEAIEWLKDPEGKAREAALEEMEEEGLIE